MRQAIVSSHGEFIRVECSAYLFKLHAFSYQLKTKKDNVLTRNTIGIIASRNIRSNAWGRIDIYSRSCPIPAGPAREKQTTPKPLSMSDTQPKFMAKIITARKSNPKKVATWARRPLIVCQVFRQQLDSQLAVFRRGQRSVFRLVKGVPGTGAYLVSPRHRNQP